MPAPFIWKPANPIPSFPPFTYNAISDMCFSADASYLAVSCGTSVQFWDLINDYPQYLGLSSKASGVASCITSFKRIPAFVSGHSDGSLCVIQESVRTKLLEGFRCKAVLSMALFDDRLLAIITSDANVRIYEVGVLVPARLVGAIPLRPTPLKCITMDLMPRAIHWLSPQQLAVSYSDAIVIWDVEVGGRQPARLSMTENIPITGSVADVTADGLALIRLPKNFKLLRLSAKHEPETIIRRSRDMAGLGPGTTAKFIGDMIFEASVGKAYLWKLDGRRLQTFILPDKSSNWIHAFAYGKDAKNGRARIALSLGHDASDGIAIWATYMPRNVTKLILLFYLVIFIILLVWKI
ncbi:hypothetical protein VKT23_014664 [Stygiomarasmius scandens]|uniref:Uncharacterized protein n=1 Tax=Marasmiellus scandens TaxID=2682957 RepID=A0ABR1J0A7_9AGAR